MNNKNKIRKIIKTTLNDFLNENKKINMKKYSDYNANGREEELTNDELKKVEWTKYKIVVPTEKDRQELMEAFEIFHYSDIDTNFVTVNQLAHEYLDDSREKGAYNNIIVNEKIYKTLNKEGENF